MQPCKMFLGMNQVRLPDDSDEGHNDAKPENFEGGANKNREQKHEQMFSFAPIEKIREFSQQIHGRRNLAQRACCKANA